MLLRPTGATDLHLVPPPKDSMTCYSFSSDTETVLISGDSPNAGSSLGRRDGRKESSQPSLLHPWKGRTKALEELWLPRPWDVLAPFLLEQPSWG